MKANFYIIECPVYEDLTVYQLTGVKGVRIGKADGWQELHLMMPDVAWYSSLGGLDVPVRIAAYGIRREEA